MNVSVGAVARFKVALVIVGVVMDGAGELFQFVKLFEKYFKMYFVNFQKTNSNLCTL